jgi:hypothetical protein
MSTAEEATGDSNPDLRDSDEEVGCFCLIYINLLAKSKFNQINEILKYIYW